MRPRSSRTRRQPGFSPARALQEELGLRVGVFRVFPPAYTLLDGRLDQFLGESASRVLSEVGGPLRAALVLYVLLYGFAILRGAIAEPMMDFAIRSVKLALIAILGIIA